MKNWWRTDEELMKKWWRTDEEMMKNWWRVDKLLINCWWRADEELMKNWWRTVPTTLSGSQTIPCFPSWPDCYLLSPLVWPDYLSLFTLVWHPGRCAPGQLLSWTNPCCSSYLLPWAPPSPPGLVKDHTFYGFFLQPSLRNMNKVPFEDRTGLFCLFFTVFSSCGLFSNCQPPWAEMRCPTSGTLLQLPSLSFGRCGWGHVQQWWLHPPQWLPGRGWPQSRPAPHPCLPPSVEAAHQPGSPAPAPCPPWPRVAFGALPPAPPLLSSARVDVKAFRSLGGRTLASSWSTSQGGLGQGVGLLEQRQHKLPERGPQQPSSPSHQDILGWQTIHSNY